MRLSIVIVVICCLAWSGHGFQQTPQAPLPSGSVDGAVNPEAIPDVVAFRLFFAALVASSSSATQVTQSELTFSSLQLTDADKATFARALATFRNKLDTASALKTATNLDALSQDCVQALKQSMSPDGFDRLLIYVRAEKRRMKRIPYPSMNSHKH
jgi:hypothetical protein